MKKPGIKKYLPLVLLLLCMHWIACVKEDPTDPTIIDNSFQSNFVEDWMEQLDSAIGKSGLSSPKAARVLAYCSIAGYEGIRHGNEQFNTLDGKLNGLAGLPQPDPGKGYHWGLVGSFAQKQVAFYLFSNATIETRQSLISLAQEHRSQLLNQGVSSELIGNSILYGENLGNAIIQWIMTDNFIQADTTSYTLPTGEGMWEQTSGNKPVLPHWRMFRAMVADPELVCSPGIPNYYSTDESSTFYEEAMEVYSLTNQLTDDQKATANYWADGKNGVLATQHALLLLKSLIRQKELDMEASAMAFVKMGIGLSDAYLNCWRTKYTHSLLRPVTYIKQTIDPNFQPYLTTPDSPEFSAELAVQSGMLLQVLQDEFGDVAFVDSSLVKKGVSPRSYSSISQMVDEAVNSGLYGGIHFRHSIEQGLYQGRCIGQKVNELDL
jgi:hypothetical protein